MGKINDIPSSQPDALSDLPETLSGAGFVFRLGPPHVMLKYKAGTGDVRKT